MVNRGWWCGERGVKVNGKRLVSSSCWSPFQQAIQTRAGIQLLVHHKPINLYKYLYRWNAVHTPSRLYDWAWSPLLCAFAYANTLAKNPQLPYFFPILFHPRSPSTRAHCERCVDCGNNSILASLHLHLLAFMVHLSVVIRILVQAKDLMITR